MNKKVLCYEIIGIFFIVILGTLLHFLYECSGESQTVALFAAVNESVWEHLKLGFWPAFLYAIIEYPFIKDDTNNFLIAKTTSLYLIPIIIVVLFYTYTGILGSNNLFIDILIFIIAVVIGQLVSYSILTSPQLPMIYSVIALLALLVITAMFLLFTFSPPDLPLFMDTNTGEYGIPSS